MNERLHSLIHSPDPFRNPFRNRFGPEFFRRIPDSAGVYWLTDSKRNILYVGRSRSLRKRLAQYKHLNITNCSFKQHSLLHLVHGIHWREVGKPHLAENFYREILQQCHPIFNSVPTRERGHVFFSMTTMENSVGLEILAKNKEPHLTKLYGAYLDKNLCNRAMTSLLRLLWKSIYMAPQIDYSPPLMKLMGPRRFQFVRPEKKTMQPPWELWPQYLDQFFEGTSVDLIRIFNQMIHQNQKWNAQPFLINWLRTDLKLVKTFYCQGPLRNYRLKKLYQLENQTLEPEWLDDFLFELAQ